MLPENVLEVGVVSDNKDWMNFDSYWCRWSRVLQRMGGKYPEAIEISIEPLNFVMLQIENPHDHHEVSKLLEMRIRSHQTSTKGESFVHRLPGRIPKYIHELVGKYFYNFLIHVDILSEIDHKVFRNLDNSVAWPWGGGIPFAMVCKDRDKFQPVLEHWFKVMTASPHYLKVQDADMLERYKQYQEKRDSVNSAYIT